MGHNVFNTAILNGGDFITRANYTGELRKLLAGMAPEDREATLDKYEEMFDGADNDEELIAKLGSPTFVALGELRGYTPPEGYVAPSSQTAEIPVISDGTARVPTGRTGKIPIVDVKAAKAAAEMKFVDFALPDGSEEPPDEPAPEMHPGKLTVYILLAVLLGVPAAVALVALSLAILAGGAAIMAAGIFVISMAFLGLDIFVDMMLLIGAGLVITALGLPLAFFAVWFFWRAAVGFISWVFRFGGERCLRQEDDGEADEPFEDQDLPLPEEVLPQPDFEPGDYDPAHYSNLDGDEPGDYDPAHYTGLDGDEPDTQPPEDGEGEDQQE